MSSVGHNSEAEIIRCINSKLEEFIESKQKFEKLQEELDTKKEDEQEPILLDLGASLFEGKKFTEDPNCGVKGDNPDARFNAWVSDNFPNLSNTFDEQERASLIWSAEHREDYWDIKERHPRVRTIRGRHAKWKEEQKSKEEPYENYTDGDVVDNGNSDRNKPEGDKSDNNSSKPPSTGSNKPRKPKPIYNPDYSIAEGMGTIKGVAELYAREYGGKPEEAADVLFSQTIKGCEKDSTSMSIARDRVKWFLELKKVMDLAEPKMQEFLNQESKLKLVK